MGKMTGNCTDTKAAITVKAVFDGNQSGQQAFGDCREGQIPRPLGRFKFDAPLLAAG